MSTGLETLARIADWLLVGSIRIGVVFLAVLIVARAWRARGAHGQVIVWRTALLTFAVLAVVPPRWSQSSALVVARSYVPLATSSEPRNAPGGASVSVPGPARPATEARRGGTVRAPADRNSGSAPAPWALAIAAIWAAGVLVRATRLGGGLLRVRRRVRGSLPIEDPAARVWRRELDSVSRRLGLSRRLAARVRLRTSTWSGVPALCGWLRPTVLLPETAQNWSGERRRSVLVHELLHLAGRDPWFSWVAATLRTLLWFHPAVGYAARQTSRFQELRCDREVVRSGIDARAYAANLVELARSASTRSAFSLPFARRSALEERVRAVLSRPPARAVTCGLRLAAALLIALAIGSSWAIQAGPQPTSTVADHTSGPAAKIVLPASVETLRLELRCDLRIRPGSEAALSVRAPSEARARELLERLDVAFEDALEDGGQRDCTVVDVGAAAPDCTVELSVPNTVGLSVLLGASDLECYAPLRSLSAVVGVGAITFAPRGDFSGSVDLLASNGRVDVDLERFDGRVKAACGLGTARLRLERAGSRGEALVTAAKGDVVVRVPAAQDVAYVVECPLGSAFVPRVPNRPVESGGQPESSAALTCYLRASVGDVRVDESGG